MPDYQLGKIYKLTSPSNNLVYYGSTAQKHLSTRIASHIRDYNCYLNNKVDYVTSFEILKCEDYKYELIEEYPCNNVYQLKTRERWYIQNNECVNKVIPNRTKAEYYQDNIEHILEQTNKYSEANKDKIKANKSEVILCECGCEVTRGQISTHKKTKKHLEFIELVQNKDNIKADTIDKVVCECGYQVVKKDDGLARHKKSKKHIRLMELLQND